jgi:hypothetical protein
MTKLIIFKEKHGDDIYDASTNEALWRACAAKVRERYREGWYYEPDESDSPMRPESQELLEMADALTPEAYAALGEVTRGKIEGIRQSQKRAQQRYLQELKDWEDIERVAQSKTLEEAASLTYQNSKGKEFNLAFRIIQDRSLGEYEEYEIVNVSEPEWDA